MVSHTASDAETQTDYYLVTSKHYYEELGLLTVYGIKARFINEEKIINDISLNKSTVNKLIDLLKDNKVEFCHFENIIEDALLSECFE